MFILCHYTFIFLRGSGELLGLNNGLRGVKKIVIVCLFAVNLFAQNYFPHKIGDELLYEFVRHSSSQYGGSSDYDFEHIIISDSTVYNDNTYIKMYDRYYYYDQEAQILYCKNGPSLDFKLANGSEVYFKFIYTETFKISADHLDGVPCKKLQYSYYDQWSYYGGGTSLYFSKDLGATYMSDYTHDNYNMSGGGKYRHLIQRCIDGVLTPARLIKAYFTRVFPTEISLDNLNPYRVRTNIQGEKYEYVKELNLHVDIVDKNGNNKDYLVLPVTPGEDYDFYSPDIVEAGDTIKWRLQLIDQGIDTTSQYYPSEFKYVTLVLPSPTDVEDDIAEPEYLLMQNFPNPFNPETSIFYCIKAPGNVKIEVYSQLGQKVSVLVDEYKAGGNYNVKFDAKNLASGIYLYTLQVNEYCETRKMLLVK